MRPAVARALGMARRRGGGATPGDPYGAELLTNGGFDDTSAWTLIGDQISITGGELVRDSATADADVETAVQAITAPASGVQYRYAADLLDLGTSDVAAVCQMVVKDNGVNIVEELLVSTGSYEFFFTPSTTAVEVRLQYRQNTGGRFDNASLRQVL